MTVYLDDGNRSRTEARNASKGSQLWILAEKEYLNVPFSTNLVDLPAPTGGAGKSKLMTRGFAFSAIAKEPARKYFDVRIHL